LWAAVVPVSAKEIFAQGTTRLMISHKIAIRFRKGIDASMRVALGDRIFRITGIINEKEENKYLMLLCQEVK
jgi:SPP1 family predicted phage head-tail adaptor